MRRAFTTLAAMLVTAAVGAQSDGLDRDDAGIETGPVYEIELIVFRHRHSQRDWTVVDALRDFRELPLATRAPEPYPADGASPTMETAWRKLEASPAYRPLQYLHWRTEAGSYEHPRRWRVHGPQPLQADHPGLSGNILPPPLAAGPPLSLLRRQVYSPLRPGPALHFRLDGMFSLAADPGLTAGLEVVQRRRIDAQSRQSDAGNRPAPAIEYQQIHQRRRIETDRLEYFDTPALAALLRVRRIELQSKPAPQAPELAPLAPGKALSQ